MLELILKDIEDKYVRENFSRLSRFVTDQAILDGDFALFDITIPGEAANFPIRHGLTFIPVDLILLYVEGDFNYIFRYQDFDKENIYVDASGPVRLRFLLGRLKDNAASSAGLAGGNEVLPLVPPGSGNSLSVSDQVIGHITIMTDSFFRISADASFRILAALSDLCGMIINGDVIINSDSSMEIGSGSSVRILGA